MPELAIAMTGEGDLPPAAASALTVEGVRETLRRSAKGANELHKLLAPSFRLHERSASLRLG